MLFFGHLGIGSRIASPWSRGLPRAWLLLGTVLPDLIDKPIYYSAVLFTGRKGCDIGLISSTRVFGHTGILLVVLALVAWNRRSLLLAALSLGVATHLMLDAVGERLFQAAPGVESSAWIALSFPLHGWRFACFPHGSIQEYIEHAFTPYLLICEVVGLILLTYDQWKLDHQREITLRYRLATPKRILKRLRPRRRQKN